jgi:hypothetical protein
MSSFLITSPVLTSITRCHLYGGVHATLVSTRAPLLQDVVLVLVAAGPRLGPAYLRLHLCLLDAELVADIRLPGTWGAPTARAGVAIIAPHQRLGQRVLRPRVERSAADSTGNIDGHSGQLRNERGRPSEPRSHRSGPRRPARCAHAHTRTRARPARPWRARGWSPTRRWSSMRGRRRAPGRWQPVCSGSGSAPRVRLRAAVGYPIRRRGRGPPMMLHLGKRTS